MLSPPARVRLHGAFWRVRPPVCVTAGPCVAGPVDVEPQPRPGTSADLNGPELGRMLVHGATAQTEHPSDGRGVDEIVVLRLRLTLVEQLEHPSRDRVDEREIPR